LSKATDIECIRKGILQATNRLADAEPLYRRVLAIFEKALGLSKRSPVRWHVDFAGTL